MALLTVEWQGVLDWSSNSDRPLIFYHIFLVKTLGVCRSIDIQARLRQWMDLWERGVHTGLVGGVEAEGMPEKLGTPGRRKKRTE